MKKNIVAVMGLMIMLSACGTNQEVATNQGTHSQQDQNVSQGVSYNIPEQCQETVGCVELAYHVEFPQNLKNAPLYQCTATQVNCETEKLKSVFGEDVQLNQETEDETKPILRADASEVHFFTPLASSIGNSLDTDAEEGNLERYKKNENLDFMPYKEAYENICSSIKKMGVDMDDTEYICYALDCDTLTNEEVLPVDMDGNVCTDEEHGAYSKEEECYYFAIWQKQQGIQEYHPYGGVFGCIAAENAPIQVLYSKNGIEQLAMEKAFTFEQQEDNIVLKDLSEINQVITDEFNDILAEETYRVVEGKFVWKTASFGKEMQPAWYFRIEYTTKKGESYTTYRLVNAETGKLINMEGVY